MPRRPSQKLREPVQVYLDRSDRALLEALSRRTGLPRAELLRRGIRRLADAELADRAPGWSFDRLVGALGSDAAIPPDLAARHDDYLYGPPGHGPSRAD
ncbi:MAG: ribbon-helix-helix domain-containing protein [Gemmatimonadales bacterium]